MRLNVDIGGKGRDVVLLHGWGLNGRIWDTLAEALAPDFRVHRIDLPGHGRSEWTDECRSLDDLTRAVAPYVPREAAVVGWSLGGMIAMRLGMLAAERIARLVLVSTTPRFVTAPDWQPAMTPAVLAGFGERLRNDYRRTIQDFLALQVRGDERELSSLRELRHGLTAGGLPDFKALEAGLEVLSTTDLRSALPQLTVPALVVSGEHDRVTPPGAGRFLAERIAGGRYELVGRSGHAPFLSHAAEFISLLQEFLSAPPADAAGAGT